MTIPSAFFSLFLLLFYEKRTKSAGGREEGRRGLVNTTKSRDEKSIICHPKIERE